jgi:hypothetical protein
MKREIEFLLLGYVALSLAVWAQASQTQAVSLERQRIAVVKLQIQFPGSYGRTETTETAAGLYIGKDQQNAYFITTAHSILFDSGVSYDLAKSVTLYFYTKPQGVDALVFDMFDALFDLGVVYIPIANLPSNMPQIVRRDPTAKMPLVIIGHPRSGDWSTWDGSVQEEYAPNDVRHFTTNSNGSLSRGFSGGPVFDFDGALLGMHVTTDRLHGFAARSEDIARQLKAWGLPAINIRASESPTRVSLRLPSYTWRIAACISLVLTWVVVLWIFPLLVLRIDEKLKNSSSLKLGWLGGIEVPLRFVALVGFFNYRPRVLDAWVTRNIAACRDRFMKSATVNERDIYLEAPVYLNGKAITSLSLQQLQGAFAQRINRVLIWGEGGTGKTSLACQIALRGMDPDPAKRLRATVMLPVLLEEDFSYTTDGDNQTLVRTVRDTLSMLVSTEPPPSLDLVLHLLRQHRILLIVDGLSELNEETRSCVRPENADFPAANLVVTSRIEAKLGGPLVTSIQPMRIGATRLLSFLEAYLAHKGKRDLFEDAEFIAARNKLSAMLGARESTVLLARLYADQMIASKDTRASSELPRSVPDLMLSYLNNLNRGARADEPSDRTVHTVAKVIAWECLRQNYQPRPVPLDNVLTALGASSAVEKHVVYLEKRLRIVQIVGVGKDRIKFGLDPLAEYLAALHLVTLYQNEEQKWRGFLDRLARVAQDPTPIRSFLIAAEDCCLVARDEFGIPAFVLEEIAKRVAQPLS